MAETNIHKELITKAANGDRLAMSELYRLYSKAMFNVSLRILKSAEEAEEILQESFLTAFKKLENFKFDSTFGTWLKSIVVNNSLNQLKKNKIEFIELLSTYDSNYESEETDEDDTELTIEKVKTAINSLPDGYRVIISLYLFEGYDHVEISSILGISVNTSKSQYSRAKVKLLEVIKSLN